MPLPEIDLSKLTPDEKLALVDVILTSLDADGGEGLSADDRASLDSAIAEAAASPAANVDWETFRDRLLKQTG
jgi:putative addiction module component (TIGR02574 family)